MAGRSALILVTRPQPQADDWVTQLDKVGVQACALPLIDISPPPDPAAVHAAWHMLGQYRLVIVVSPNAAQAFVAHRPALAQWPALTWAAAPGPGTAEALRQQLMVTGLATPTVISPPPDSPQFDSEHLWPSLSALDWTGQRVLIVSGSQDGLAQGRTWLTTQLETAGAQVKTVVAYGRQAARWDTAQQQLAAQAYEQPECHPWLFSSSEAIAYLLDKQGPPPARAMAMTTHPRIAATARQAGFEQVFESSPRFQNLALALKALPTVASTPRT
jgi:uroporphyrinogen-III synthase